MVDKYILNKLNNLTIKQLLFIYFLFVGKVFILIKIKRHWLCKS